MRIDQRALDQLREVKITRNYTRYAEGSVLVEFGHTKVLCTASIDNSVPRFFKRAGTRLGNCRIWHVATFNSYP